MPDNRTARQPDSENWDKEGEMAEEKRCENIPAYRYTWPGKNEAVSCPEHAMQLAGIAQAIGLHLQLIPLQPNEIDGKQCAQMDDR